MKKIILIKQQQVSDLTTSLKEAKGFVVFEYTGLNAADLANARRVLNSNNAKLKIVKNNILNRAIKANNWTEFGHFKGQNAIAYSPDELSAFKAVAALKKQSEKVTIKSGYLDNTFLNESQVISLSSLANRESIFSMLLASLKGMSQKLVLILDALAKTKQ